MKIEKLKEKLEDVENFLEGWKNIIERSGRLENYFRKNVEETRLKYHDEIINSNGNNEITFTMKISFNDLWNIQQLLFDGRIQQWHVRDEHWKQRDKLRNKIQKELNK